MSKAYISQVKNGKRPPSQKLVDAIAGQIHETKPKFDYLDLFLKSRQSIGVSPSTLQFYHERLSKFTATVDYLKASRREIEQYLSSIPANEYGLATRHASYRTIKTLYRWLSSEYGLPNPVNDLSAPILGKPILPALSTEQVKLLIDSAHCVRDKAIIALFTESGLRLSELANIKASDIDWSNKTIKVMGKGRKEALAPFGGLSEGCLREWLAHYEPNGNIWGMNNWGITSMLRRLEQ